MAKTVWQFSQASWEALITICSDNTLLWDSINMGIALEEEYYMLIYFYHS